jgi:hypothetical protein
MELVDASTKNVDLVYQLAYGKEAKILILFGARDWTGPPHSCASAVEGKCGHRGRIH